MKIRTRSASAPGGKAFPDMGNSFGIGAEIDCRAGSWIQKQVVTKPVTHFGLGFKSNADFVGVQWLNGALNGEGLTPADQLHEIKQYIPW